MKINKSDTTRACVVCLQRVVLKVTTYFDSSLDHHQVVSLYRGNYTMYDMTQLYIFFDKDLLPDDGLMKSRNM